MTEIEEKKIVRYWRKRGGWGRGYWLDESREKSDDRHEVKIKPVAPENDVPIWVDIKDVDLDEESLT